MPTRRLGRPAAELLLEMATIQAATPSDQPFIGEMVKATGLTKDQIRQWRSKTEYKKLLELTRASLSQPRYTSGLSSYVPNPHRQLTRST